MGLVELLQVLIENKGSDLFLSPGSAPAIKIDGKLAPLDAPPLTHEAIKALLFSVMTPEQQEAFKQSKEFNFAISIAGLGRFRMSAFYQRSTVGAVFRAIKLSIPSLQSLKLPMQLENLALIQRGLVLIVGATGSGKSTTLAAMVDHRNQLMAEHIISIEDPIEYLHQNKKSIVTQREVGIDTESYEVALKNTLRQAPNVIMIGEVRTKDTMNYALTFAETGHLCVSTLHANNADQALERIMSFFPAESMRQLRMELSMNLKAIVAQQLISKMDEIGRVPAVEILLNTPIIADHIRSGDTHAIKEIMAKSREQDMQTFDQSLYDLYTTGQISYDSALQYADSENELRLMIKLHSAPPGTVGKSDFNMKDN